MKTNTERAREFINNDEIKAELDAVTRIWLEQHIIVMLDDLTVDFVRELKDKYRLI